MDDRDYAYSFVVWPDERCDFRRAVFALFDVLSARVEMQFTEEKFVAFRADLAHEGFTLRECTRRAVVTTELVY